MVIQIINLSLRISFLKKEIISMKNNRCLRKGSFPSIQLRLMATRRKQISPA